MDEVSTVTSSNVLEKHMTMREDHLVSWKTYVKISKMGIVYSNLITTFTGLFLAAHYTGAALLDNLILSFFALLGTGLVIAGGCALNNYIDRDIDHLMERTRSRPSVTGTLSGKQVISYGLAMSVIGLIILSFLSLTAAFISFIGLFVYVVIYSLWTKRTTTLNTIIGSVAGAVPPLIGWAIFDPSLHPVAWSLFLIMFMWQPPHFLALAMRRLEDYKRAEIPMLPVIAGIKMTKRQINWYILVLIPISLTLVHFGVLYTITALLLGVGWLVLGLSHRKYKDEKRWAKHMFIYSLYYMLILFTVMIFVHVF